MNKLKIALLCNNKMAAPAMEQLARAGILCGIATADKDPEVMFLFKKRAAELGIPYSCVSRSGFAAGLQDWVRAAGADIVFVMTFPWRLPQAVLAAAPLGFLNFHYGLLPQMRGADPVFESVRGRMDKAGVTVHIIDEGLDTGPVVLREDVPMNAELTYGMLAAQLAYKGAEMCATLTSPLSPLYKWTAGSVPAEREGVAVQDETQAKYWPKVGIESIAINWQEMDSGTIKALVKSCNPVARGVPVIINNWRIGVCEVGEVNLEGDARNIKPGTIVAHDMQNGLIVYCCDGKGLKLEVVYTEEGYLPGYKLGFFGITVGMAFG